MNLTRTGKIARLPRAVRDQLDQRFLEGQKAKSFAPAILEI
jgi:hypothetical protein